MTDGTVTLTGDNNYTGFYDANSFTVLGGANNGGQTDSDTTDGNETFLFGNLQYKSTTDYGQLDSSVLDDHTWQTTATGTSADTLHFSFTFDPGSDGGVLGAFTPDPGDDGVLSQGELSSQYSNFLISLGIDPGIWAQNSSSDPLPGYGDGDVESALVNTGGPNFDTRYWEGTPTSGEGTDPSLTADHSGDKTLLGFSVGSDHIALDGVTDESMFDSYFTVTSSTHLSANNNVVNDTIISLNGGDWSVDLYGVDTTAFTTEADLQHYVYTNIVAG